METIRGIACVVWENARHGKIMLVFNPLHLEEHGFAVVPECLTGQMVEHLCSDLGNAKHAQRNLLRVPIVREVASSEPIKQLIRAVLGSECFAVRGILFNKTPNSNWKVVWHQDRIIAVRERKEAAHFGPWS